MIDLGLLVLGDIYEVAEVTWLYRLTKVVAVPSFVILTFWVTVGLEEDMEDFEIPASLIAMTLTSGTPALTVRFRGWSANYMLTRIPPPATCWQRLEADET